MYGYITPEVLPSKTVCRLLRIPDDVDWKSIVNGALSELTKAHNFEQIHETSLTAEQTTEIFGRMFFEYLTEYPCMLGAVVLFATEDYPDGTLPCDGSTFLRADYPNLYDVLSAQYIVDGTSFKTPNVVSLVGLNYRMIAR